jgi:hypothetical protein
LVHEEDVSLNSDDDVLATGITSLEEVGESRMGFVNYSKNSVGIIGGEICVDELYPTVDRSFNGNGNSVYDDFARKS